MSTCVIQFAALTIADRGVRKPCAVRRRAQPDGLSDRRVGWRCSGPFLDRGGDPHLHRRNELVAASKDGTDDALRRSVVADRLANGSESGRQGGLTDESVAPDLIQKLVLADNAITMLDQVDEHIEHLWFDMLMLTRSNEFEPICIDGARVEFVLRNDAPYGPRRWPRQGFPNG
jgi:hypothetical protein